MTDRSTSSIAPDAASATWPLDRAAIDAALDETWRRSAPRLDRASEPIRYALLGRGKRLRGLLLLAAHRAAGGQGSAIPLAAALEIVHAYSLVHDDLPCMDDDDMRRGRPTTHRMYGVELATAAGLAMIPLAARAAFDAGVALGVDDAIAADLVGAMMRAAGGGAMIGGQLLDLEAEGRPLALEALERVHRAKTGALITAAVVIGGMAARGNASTLRAFERFGGCAGLAFQIADDLLDVMGNTATLGKEAGRDIDLRKSTYPALLGVEQAGRRAEELIREGGTALRDAGVLSTELETLARFIIQRTS